MNTAIILAGGTGTRMHLDTPKQYLMVNNKPIICYSLETFENNKEIDNIIIVLNKNWESFVKEQVEKYNITKVIGYAEEGITRQHSIYNGLKYIKNKNIDTTTVIIHDAARPSVTDEMITDCIKTSHLYDGATPVIPLEDTIFLSKNGKKIDNLTKRSELFSGQTPEGFDFNKYYNIHYNTDDKELWQVTGSSDIAYKHGMDISLFKGNKNNFKITTPEDLEKFKFIINQNG